PFPVPVPNMPRDTLLEPLLHTVHTGKPEEPGHEPWKGVQQFEVGGPLNLGLDAAPPHNPEASEQRPDDFLVERPQMSELIDPLKGGVLLQVLLPGNQD